MKSIRVSLLWFATIGVSALPLFATAAAFQYECEVKQIHDIGEGAVNNRPRDIALGQKFTISRQTGEIVGSPAYALSRGWKEFRVIDSGSNGQAYKFVAISDGFPNVVFVSVREFEKGPTKTFVYLNNFLLTTGTCI